MAREVCVMGIGGIFLSLCPVMGVVVYSSCCALSWVLGVYSSLWALSWVLGVYSSRCTLPVITCGHVLSHPSSTGYLFLGSVPIDHLLSGLQGPSPHD